jgi:hypothetical protein
MLLGAVQRDGCGWRDDERRLDDMMTLVVIAEKVLPHGRRIAAVVAAGLVAL